MSSIKVIFIFVITCCVFANSELHVRVKVTPQVYVNNQVNFAIIVTNNTANVIQNIIVKHQIPSGFTYRGRKTGKFALKWHITALQPQASKQFTFSLDTLREGNFVTVTQVLVIDKIYEVCSTINVVAPNLVVKVTASSRVIYSLRPVVLKITISNIGSGSAYNIDVEGILDETLKCISSKPQAKKSQKDLLGKVKWKIPEISSNAEVVLEVIARGVVIDQNLPFTGRVYGQNAYRVIVKTPDKEYRRACSVRVFGQPMYLHISTYDRPDPVKLNEQTVYIITVRNEGTNVATNIMIYCDLPVQMEFVSVESHYIYDKNIHQVKFAKITTLQPGEKVVYKVTCRAINEGSAKYSTYLRYDQFNYYILDEEGTSIYK